MKKKKVKRKSNNGKPIWMVWGTILLAVIVIGVVVRLGDVKQLETQNLKYESIQNCNPGTVVEKEKLDLNHIDRYFTVENISEEVAADMQGKSYRENPEITMDDLRYLKVLHYNFDHEIQVGELVVNKDIAQDCREIFMELFLQGYEIKSMYRIDRYYEDDGDGEAADCNSINQDNTSGFNYRLVNGTNQLSEHALGYALDINPMENPTMAVSQQDKDAGKYLHWEEYSDRTVQKPHMIQKGDVCYEIFTKHGFVWGGEWNGPLDYQHFEKGTAK